MNWNLIKDLQRIFDTLDDWDVPTVERDYPIIWEKVHATSCAQIGRMLAEIRNIDIEQAALACALHDIGRWENGKQLEHALNGEEPVRRFLVEGNYSEKNRELIVKAVVNHSKKEQIGTPLEELVKDADLLDCHWHGEHSEKPHHVARLNKALSDLGIRCLKERVVQ